MNLQGFGFVGAQDKNISNLTKFNGIARLLRVSSVFCILQKVRKINVYKCLLSFTFPYTFPPNFAF
jgi:hypothetical protein